MPPRGITVCSEILKFKLIKLCCELVYVYHTHILYDTFCSCGGGKAALLSSSGYQLLKAAGGTAGFKGACPCFGDWCFQPLGWRWGTEG